jgi:chemotaxis protein methyltransferase CheR
LIQALQGPAYERLKDQLIAATGLAFYADRNELLAGAIGARLTYLGLRDCSSYAGLLSDGKRGRDEMETLTAQLTIGETYFFRDEEFYSALREIVLPDILERRQSSKRLRIWSAGCAAGAEPYSLAIILMDEMAARIAGWQVDIYATDLSKDSLTRAAAGKFRAAALRSTSDRVKRECFSKEGLIWTIHPRYKRWISFHHMNLVGSGFSTAFSGGLHFDLILCRNVMIYFAPEVIHRLIGRFHESLEDWGWLVVGSSEYGLDNYKAYRTVNAPGARLYQKAIVRPPSETVETRRPAAPTQRLAAKAGRQPAGTDPLVSQCPEDMDGLRTLADRGDWQGAADYGQRLLAQDRLNPALHFYRALIFENLGTADEPERSLRQAIYLDRNFALAHYHLGLALKKHGEIRAAARSFGNVLKVLAGTAADQAIVTAGSGVTATVLKELARMHMAGSSRA